MRILALFLSLVLALPVDAHIKSWKSYSQWHTDYLINREKLQITAVHIVHLNVDGVPQTQLIWKSHSNYIYQRGPRLTKDQVFHLARNRGDIEVFERVR